MYPISHLHKMKDYDILYIIIAISISGVAFKIDVEELDVLNLFKVKSVRIIFTSKYNTELVNKMYGTIKYYYRYKLPLAP